MVEVLAAQKLASDKLILLSGILNPTKFVLASRIMMLPFHLRIYGYTMG